MAQPSPSTRILGGGQFNHRFSSDPASPACLRALSISPEQAVYNALTIFFYGTPAASAPLVGET
jgi:hypothetical protein